MGKTRGLAHQHGGIFGPCYILHDGGSGECDVDILDVILNMRNGEELCGCAVFTHDEADVTMFEEGDGRCLVGIEV